ncbi:YveK family protein [Macrococcus capreoli]|uniref:YveK family protein n=1 Tax=Macrococcus capreoli TaxID=2982690 RepID=UPI003EE4AE46
MEEVLDLGKIIKMIRKNTMLIIGLSVLGALFSAFISFFLITPIYSASTQVLVNKNEIQSQMDLQSTQADLQLINTYSEIMKSPVILDEVAKNLKIDTNIQKKVTVTSTNQSKVITITVNDTSDKMAVSIANEITKVFKKKINKIMKVDNVTVLNEAKQNLNAKPIKPQPIFNILIGVLLGAILGFIFGFVRDILDKRIQNEEDVKNELNIPVLGSIPHFEENLLGN